MSQILFPLSLFVFLAVPYYLALKSNKMPDIAEINQDIPLVEELVPLNFPKITVALLNCNSLNMATVNKQTKIRKFYGHVSLKTDIIFVSDIRMCNKGGVSDIKFIRNIFSTNPYCSYNFYHHSHSSSRGVGILVKNLQIFLAQAKVEIRTPTTFCYCAP